MLRGSCVSGEVINMLLEIPSGLHFSELEIDCTYDRLPSSAVKLAEACGETLVKLSHRAGYHCKFYPFRWSSLDMLTRIASSHLPYDDIFERSFDLSKLPNVREVTFGVWADDSGPEGLPWIPAALSTLRPATSPYLSVIRLDLRSSTSLLVEDMITNMGNDLRRTADEVGRIEREFEGAVNFAVLLGSGFGAVLDNLSVRFRFVGWKRPRDHAHSSSFVPCRSFRTIFIEME